MSNPTNGDITYVVCVRDPDSANEFTIDGDANVEVIDIDLGCSDLTNKEEFLDWAEARIGWYDDVEEDQYDDVRNIIAGYVLQFGAAFGYKELPDVRQAIREIGGTA